MQKKLIHYIIYFIFISITIFGSYNVYKILNEYKKSSNIYNKLNQFVEENQTISEEQILPTVDFASLKNINNDVIGWIYIDNLNISYPILQGVDNDFYLKHMVDGSYNNAGSIYLDYRNNHDLSSKHNIIYGHNMLDGSMFTNLTRYKDQSFYDNNKTYLIMTPYENFVIEVFSGYVIVAFVTLRNE